jgi:hypothetical protein
VKVLMPEHTEPLGKRIGRFILLLGVVFAISAGFIVTQRLSRDSLALLIGLSCGVAAMLPTVVIFVLWMRREDSRRKDIQIHSTPQNQPQVIVVAPQSIPGYGSGYSNSTPAALPSQWQPPVQEREFKIVGGTD